jgi:hypothetical protein
MFGDTTGFSVLVAAQCDKNYGEVRSACMKKIRVGILFMDAAASTSLPALRCLGFKPSIKQIRSRASWHYQARTMADVGRRGRLLQGKASEHDSASSVQNPDATPVLP